MAKTGCDREADVLACVSEGRWPLSCEEELRHHVLSCAICSDVVEVADALTDDRTTIMRHAPVPGSGLVWWRMQMRLRQETIQNASRTMTSVQVLIIATTVCVAVLAAGALTVSGHGWTPLLSDIVSVFKTSFIATSGADRVTSLWFPLLLALATWLALAPIAVYLAVTED